MKPIRRALTIAGSDSGGCAGIQADLKTFGALGIHGMSVIVSVTAQDTTRVHDSVDLPLSNIELQLKAVIEDIGVDALKTGMLSTAKIISLVERKIREYELQRVVVDPVMVSTGGDRLIREDAVEVLKTCLFPLAMVVTPNISEAEVLAGGAIGTHQELKEAAAVIRSFGSHAVIVKGGHFKSDEESVDLFYDGGRYLEFRSPRVPTRNTHGSGCTFAAAITACLAKGETLENAVGQAKEYVSEAIRHAFPLGHGNGPLCHFYRYWGSED